VAQHQPHDLISNLWDRRHSDHIVGLAQDLVSRAKRQVRPAQHDGRTEVLQNHLVGRTVS
jgi:hypothetical protein